MHEEKVLGVKQDSGSGIKKDMKGTIRKQTKHCPSEKDMKGIIAVKSGVCKSGGQVLSLQASLLCRHSHGCFLQPCVAVQTHHHCLGMHKWWKHARNRGKVAS